MSVIEKKLTGPDLDAARMVALEALHSAVNDLDVGRCDERADLTAGRVMRLAWVLRSLGTPTTHPLEFMFRWAERDQATLAEAAVEVERDLTTGLDPHANEAEDRERRFRPTIKAAQRVQTLLGGEVAR